MSEWNCQIVKVESVDKHPDADNLDVVKVLGDYPVIVKRNEYKVGDLSAYISIDTIVPDTQLFYFLCPKVHEKYEENGEVKTRQLGSKYPLGSIPEKYRIIKAKKIRGIYSTGMLLNINSLPPNNYNIGYPVQDILNLKKWEEENEENVPLAKKSRGINAAPPPNGWNIPYYDLDSVRKYISCVENEKDIILTEKTNGSNASFCFDGQKLVIKSRNYYKKHDPDDMWVDVAIRYDLENKLSKYPMIALFGEIVNQVKNFKYSTEIKDGKLVTKLYCFDAYDIKKNRYLDYDEFKAIVDDLGLDTAPVLYRGPWTNKEEMYAYAEGMSVLNPKVIREGWVLGLGKERFESRLNGRLKLKLISQQYSLSK